MSNVDDRTGMRLPEETRGEHPVHHESGMTTGGPGVTGTPGTSGMTGTRWGLGGTFSAEAIAAAGALVLAILGLADVADESWFTSIGSIVLGAALLLKSGAFAARFRALRGVGGGTASGAAAPMGGISLDLVAGATGIALGLLALVGVQPVILTAVAVIVFGCTLLLNTDAGRMSVASAAADSSGFESLAGIAAIVLGIIAIPYADFELSLTLILVGLLVVSAVYLLRGLAMAGRMMSSLR